MCSVGLNVKNILLSKLSYPVVSSIILCKLVYGYELCEIIEECFSNKKFIQEKSFKKSLKRFKQFRQFFNKSHIDELEIFLAFNNENSYQSSIKIDAIEKQKIKIN